MACRLDLLAKREHGLGVAREDAEVGIPVPGDQRSVANGSEQRAEVEPVDDAMLVEQLVREVDQLQQVLGAAVGAQVALAPVPEPAVRGRSRAQPDGSRRGGHERTIVKLCLRRRSMIWVVEIPLAYGMISRMPRSRGSPYIRSSASSSRSSPWTTRSRSCSSMNSRVTASGASGITSSTNWQAAITWIRSAIVITGIRL